MLIFFPLQHTTILTGEQNAIKAKIILPSMINAPVVFKGVGMTADPDNPLVLEILTASSTAYSYFPDEKITEVCLKFNGFF